MNEKSRILYNVSPPSVTGHLYVTKLSKDKVTHLHTETNTYPQVSVCQVWIVMSRVGAIDGLLAVNLNYATVLNIPRVLQLIEDITGLIFDEQSSAGRPEHPWSSEQRKTRR